MKPLILTARELTVLAVLAGFGLLVPNGIFLWYCFAAPETLRAALANPVTLVFVAEAFFLMFLFAWLLARAGVRRPGGLGFILLSVAGSLAFSVPAALWLMQRDRPTPPSAP